MKECDTCHSVSFPLLQQKEDLTLHLLTHSFALGGLREPPTYRTATTIGCLCTIFYFLTHTQPDQPLTSFPNTNALNNKQSCVLSLYILWQGHGTLSLVSLILDWYFIWTTWHDMLITIITQYNTPITVYVHDLDTAVSFGMCRACWFAYHFTHYQHSILIWHV